MLPDKAETWAHLRHCQKEFATNCSHLADANAKNAHFAPDARPTAALVNPTSGRRIAVGPTLLCPAAPMNVLARLKRFSVLAALSLASTGCSVEQASNRCAKETTSLDGLIQCARDLHAKAQRCEPSQAGKGALPVAGSRVLKFGDVTNYGGTSKGIVFEVAAGADVHSPLAGTVTFADKYRSYGDLVIIDSCSKVALMAGAFVPDVMAGQSIGAGGSIAKMQPAATGAPVLYLEVRENGTAIDPASLIPAN